jgi:hypothetical protein
MKKRLFIDYSKWRCGGDSRATNMLGKEETALLNDKGYMCCLGQWALQFGCEKKDILNEGEPCHINVNVSDKIPLLVNSKMNNTRFSNRAMKINDDTKTTPEEKIAALKVLLEKKGMKLIIKNKK